MDNFNKKKDQSSGSFSSSRGRQNDQRKKRSFNGGHPSERRSFGGDRGGYGNRRRFSEHGNSNEPQRRFFKPRSEEDNRQGGYERQGSYSGRSFGQKSYAKDGEQRSYGRGGEQRSYGRGGEQGSYGRGGEQRSYGRGGEQRSYGRGGEQRSYGNRQNDRKFYRKPKRVKAEEVYDPNKPIRLNKYLSNAGICSRRDADQYIQAGVITVNGKVVTEMGTKVMREDVVKFHDEAVKLENKVYVLLNKPKGYVTTVDDPQNRKTVMDLVKNACPERIYPVGRLDRNTTGVLLLTNDGELSVKLTHPQYRKRKIYHVYLDRNISLTDMQHIMDGVQLEDGDIKADDIQYVDATDKKQVGIEIHSGRNRIVRRIFESLDYKVLKLDRVYFAGLTKKRLKRGDWRFLTDDEINFLRMGSFE